MLSSANLMMFVAFVTSMFNLIQSEASLCPTTPFCYCDKTAHVADCSWEDVDPEQPLTSIPQLPSYVYHILLDGNNFTTIVKDTFNSISGNNITSISMTNAGLQYIASDAFEALTHLQSLNLSFNDINITSLKLSLFSLKSHNMQRLDFKDIGWNNTCGEGLTYLQSLLVIDFFDNSIEVCNTNVLPRTLKELNLSVNKLKAVPNFCSPNNTSNAPSLRKLKLDFNIIKHIRTQSFNCLPSIEIINIDGNPLLTIASRPFYNLNGLHTLSASDLNVPSFYDFDYSSDSFYVPSLKKFTFHSNIIIPNLTNCTHLEYVDVSCFQTLEIFEIKMEDIFGRLPNLTHLDMSQSHWKSIPKGFFELFPNLEYVDLRDNDIIELTCGQFFVQSRIKKMFLGSNSIYHIGYDTFPPKFWQNIELLDLSFNPFHCDCNLLWFRDKFKASPKTFGMGSVYPQPEYKCSSPPELSRLNLTNFNLTYNECKQKPDYVTVFVSCGSIVVVVVIVFVILYKGRWHIRYWIYLLRYRGSAYRRLSDADIQYAYDAFVIFADEDEEFVINTLSPRLEKEQNFRLCIHDRDFQPGKLIVKNIVESIENSRITIVVLSKSFFKKRWCKFELTMAQDRWLNKKTETLLPVMLEDLESKHMTRDIRVLIKITTYVRWTDDPVGQRLFWDKVVNTLRGGN